MILVITSIATSYGIVIPELKAAIKPSASIGARATMFNGILCNSGETNCVESYGMNIDVKNATGTRTFGVTASSGAVTANQLTVGTLVSQTVGYDTQGTFAVTAPTSVASATPAARVNSLGANNDLLVVEKASTPVFKVGNSGAITGNVLQYGSTGQKVVCGSTVITGTGAIAHGLATPSYVTYAMAQDATGDGARLSHTNITATVTLKAWNTALTPAPATTPVTTNWCVVGTP